MKSDLVQSLKLEDSLSKGTPSMAVYRVGTEAFQRGKTFVYARTLTRVARKSNWEPVEEEVYNVGAREGLESITNLLEVPDGLYYVVTTNEQRDWETGYIDSYDLKLVPYPEELENPTPHLTRTGSSSKIHSL